MSNTVLHNCKRLEVRSSPVEGYGVFATDEIKAGEVLEEVPFVLFPRHVNLSQNIYALLHSAGFLSSKEQYFDNLRQNLKFKDPEKYYFKWMPPQPLNGEQITYTVLPLGYGPIYNTSNSDNNAGWTIREKTFIFRAEKDIKKDEEIRTFYGYFVGHDGAIFNCDTVFNLGLDLSANNQAKVKMIRFASVEQFEQGKQNPIYQRLGILLSISKDGLALARISAALITGEEKVAFDFPLDMPLSFVYHKILEFRNSQFPIIKIIFKYEDKNTGTEMAEGIAFKK